MMCQIISQNVAKYLNLILYKFLSALYMFSILSHEKKCIIRVCIVYAEVVTSSVTQCQNFKKESFMYVGFALVSIGGQ